MKRDYLAWAALAAAIAVTASAEYALARACGFGPWVAVGVPGALDIYAIRALRARRDVLAVVVAMIAVNAASHLVTAGLLPVSVPLVVAVSAIAPLVLWRVHALREGVHSLHTPGEDPAGEADVPADVPVIERVPEPVPDVPEHVPGAYPQLPRPVPEVVPAGVRLLPIVPRPKSAEEPAAAAVYPAAEEPRTRPEVRAEYVPDVPEPSEPEDELTAQARRDFADYLAAGALIPYRLLRERYGIGQTRAQRIRDELKKGLQ